jgi:hypothetical protein
MSAPATGQPSTHSVGPLSNPLPHPFPRRGPTRIFRRPDHSTRHFQRTTNQTVPHQSKGASIRRQESYVDCQSLFNEQANWPC